MHVIHHTKGFVISLRQSKESDFICSLLTEKFGLIKAVAQGVRLQKSKLRYSLVPYSLIEVSLVRGKNIWRVTGAQTINPLFYILDFKNERELLARASELIERLVHGEEDNGLFSIIDETFSFLSSKNLEEKELGNIECILMLRILHNLGYVGESDRFREILFEDSWRNAKIFERQPIVKEINRALKESGL